MRKAFRLSHTGYRLLRFLRFRIASRPTAGLVAGMGLFDRFSGKKTPSAGAAASEKSEAPAPVPAAGGGVRPRLDAAREKLDGKDLEGALAIYEELLGTAGDRADVLVAISGDLGSHGHVAEIIELIAPRYDAERHGPATGINLIQAYLAVRNADAAQHVLDILFGLNRPELEDRLHGFSNAIAEIMTMPHAPGPQIPGAPELVPQVSLITISKPIWFYGLEELSAQILPPKGGRLRRIGFAQLALPEYDNLAEAVKKPEDELARFSRGLPLWLAETFYFTALYEPVGVIGLRNPPGEPSHPMIFGAEWTVDNLRQLVDTSQGGLDYVITGALTAKSGDYELLLRVWEVKSFREKKTFSARWTPATADAALSHLHADVRRYMEWSPASAALAYTPPTHPLGWIDTLGASLGLFLAEKSLLPPEILPDTAADLKNAASRAAASEPASLAFLTLRARAAKLGVGGEVGNVPLARSTIVNEAARQIAG